jgi:lipopolysaccharide assembly outer membrane protein LptD (OstA)
LGYFLKRALRRLAIAVVLVVTLAPVLAFAATQASKPKPGAVPVPVRTEHQEPVNVTGQETIYDSKTDTFVVKGDAVMIQGGSVLKADQIDIMRRDRKARAIGHVHLVDPEVEMWATEANIDITNETMVLYNAKVLAKHDVYHLEGKEIIKEQGQTYLVKNGFFTTCGCEKGTPSWAINAKQMTVNVGQTGHAQDATFDVAGIPLIPTPYFPFPADSSRHSGFISGREGESGLRGFQWLQPYFLDINKSSDATVALDIETSQRVGGLGEYRLTNGLDDYFWVDGAFYNESLRSETNRVGDVTDTQLADPHIPIDRFGIIGMTRQHLTDNLIAYADAVSVSDSLYLREMDVWTLSRGFGSNFGSLRNAPADFGLLDEFENGFARLQGQWNQDLIQPGQFALQRLPDGTVSGRQELFNNLMFADYDAEVVDFYRESGVDGLRLDANPRVTLPWRWGDYAWGYGQVGTQANFYDTSGRNLHIIPIGTTPAAGTQPTCAGGGGQELVFNNCVGLSGTSGATTSARVIPYIKTGVATLVDRVYDVQWKSIDKIKNTIQPFASYSYVPRIYQGNQPLFDQTDRLNSRSLLTYGFTTRWFAKSREEEPSADTEDTDDSSNPETADEDSGVNGPLHEDPLAGPQIPHGGSILRDGERSQQIGSLTIQQAYDTSHQVAQNSNLSDIQALSHIYALQFFTFSSEVDYSPRQHAGVSFADAAISVEPPWERPTSSIYMGRTLQGSFLQLDYNYSNRRDTVFPPTNKQSSELVSGRAYTEVFDRLGLYFSPSYDLGTNKFLATEYGLRLKSPCDCWAADFGVTDSVNPNETLVQVQLTLGGLGSFGQSPFGRNPFQRQGLVGSSTGVLPNY